ncbi:MAG: hypothetical protein A4S08_06435 [Proteobacteria bacterium SG_bin4]|nr:MAG: hypothetical protein A4S08_06435 [Proteobacteria bacterium SG_bin4]
MKLGEQLSRASNLIVDLIEATNDIDQKKKLRNYLTIILDISGKLVDEIINSDTEKYKQANNAFEEANGKIEEAIEDIKKVAETINKIAKAIDLAAKVADTAA